MIIFDLTIYHLLFFCKKDTKRTGSRAVQLPALWFTPYSISQNAILSPAVMLLNLGPNSGCSTLQGEYLKYTPKRL